MAAAADSKWTHSEPNWVLKRKLTKALSADEIRAIAAANGQWAVKEATSMFRSWSFKNADVVMCASPLDVSATGRVAYERLDGALDLFGPGETRAVNVSMSAHAPAGRRVHLDRLIAADGGFDRLPALPNCLKVQAYGGTAVVFPGSISVAGFTQLSVARHALSQISAFADKYTVDNNDAPTAYRAKPRPTLKAKPEATIASLTTAVAALTVGKAQPKRYRAKPKPESGSAASVVSLTTAVAAMAIDKPPLPTAASATTG